MQSSHEDSKEITLVSILNYGLIEFDRIIENNDNAFILKHHILLEKTQIVLFVTPGSDSLYKMFLYEKGSRKILKTIKYNKINNTWSYYNSLCKTLYRVRKNIIYSKKNN